MTDRDLTGLVNAHSQIADQVAGWRKEIDDFLAMMQHWAGSDPDAVMEEISSIAARLIEIRCVVVRSESRNMQAFRTKELDPLLSQMEFQFKIHSRRLSSMSFDWEVSRGQAT